MVKIMNKNYRMASSSSSSTSVIQSTIIQNQSYQLFTLRGNVKVSIQTGNAIDLVKGKEARVPLLHEDFVQVNLYLQHHLFRSLQPILNSCLLYSCIGY